MGRHFKTYSHSLIDVQLANGHSRNSSTSTATATVSSASYIPVTTSLLSSTTPLRLAPKDEPTRIQLQKQRLREQHVRAPVSAAIPGFKTSAGMLERFFYNSSQRASLDIPLEKSLQIPPEKKDTCIDEANTSPPQLSLALYGQIYVSTLRRRRVLYQRPILCKDRLLLYPRRHRFPSPRCLQWTMSMYQPRRTLWQECQS